MGGTNSGRRVSDEEKRKKGSYQPCRSEEANAKRAAEKIISGPWLKSIPEPQIPLGEVGRKKYDEYANLLFKGNKLTSVTCDDCERFAVLWEQMHEARAAGRKVSMQAINRMDAIAARLRIADEAPAIANPNQKNRFAGSGFSNQRSSPIRLRSSTSGTGEL